MHAFQEISQGAQDGLVLSQGISQGAQHDQRLTALVGIGFAMPVSATHIARAIEVSSVWARTAALSDSPFQMAVTHLPRWGEFSPTGNVAENGKAAQNAAEPMRVAAFQSQGN